MHECRGWTHTSLDAGLLFLRVLAGATMAMHGYDKVFGGIMPQLVQGVGAMGFPLPTLFAWLAALSELVGGLCVVLGVGTRVASFFVFVTMGVAFFVAHGKDPFQMKELAFVYGALFGALIGTGAGRFSVDALCCRKKGAAPAGEHC